jgi:hypothetical protein
MYSRVYYSTRTKQMVKQFVDDFPPVPIDLSLLRGAPLDELAGIAYDKVNIPKDDEDGIVEAKSSPASGTNWTLVWVVVGITLAVILIAWLMYRNRK